MQHSTDLRVIKTKNSLHNAFFAMLEEMSIEDITVNDLCARAGIRRATFYKHFEDKLSFITFIIGDIRESFDREFLKSLDDPEITVEYYLSYVEAVGDFLTKRETAISKILHSPMRATFISIFMQQNYVDTLERLERSVRDGMKLPTSAPVVTSMLIGGISHNVLRWFELEERPPIDFLLNDISEFIQAVLK